MMQRKTMICWSGTGLVGGCECFGGWYRCSEKFSEWWWTISAMLEIFMNWRKCKLDRTVAKSMEWASLRIVTDRWALAAAMIFSASACSEEAWRQNTYVGRIGLVRNHGMGEDILRRWSMDRNRLTCDEDLPPGRDGCKEISMAKECSSIIAMSSWRVYILLS